MVIERKTLRAQVRDELLARMRSGAVQPGEGINEVQLAGELGVSRTPLREALIGLETEGQITSENGKGFRFAKLTAAEYRDLGPIIAALEGLALEQTPAELLPGIGEKLRALANDFSSDVAEYNTIMAKDDVWHHTMLEGTGNRRLRDMIENTRELLHRFESLLVPDEAMIDRVAAEHLRIAECLIEGRLADAQAALVENWANGIRRTLDRASISYLAQ